MSSKDLEKFRFINCQPIESLESVFIKNGLLLFQNVTRKKNKIKTFTFFLYVRLSLIMEKNWGTKKKILEKLITICFKILTVLNIVVNS